jgi:hypothetical protein
MPTRVNPNMIRLQWAMLLLVYMVTPTILAVPKASFTTDVDSEGPPYFVYLNAITSSPWQGNQKIVDFKWSNSKNGSILPNITSAAIFDTVGTYSITLTVWDAAGNFDTLTKSVTIGNARPPVKPTPTPLQPSNDFSSPTPRFNIVRTDGLIVYVNASASIPGGNNDARITNYEYYAMLGTKISGPYTATTPQTSFTLDEAGRYQISLDVTDSNRNSSSTPAQRTVDVQTAQSNTPVTGTLTANFITGTIDGCRVSVNASGSSVSSGQIEYKYTWRQTGSTESGNITRYSDYADITLPQSGNYMISLQVSDEDGNSSTNASTQNVTVPQNGTCSSTSVTTQPGIETLYGGNSVNESTDLVFDTNGGNKFFTIRNTGDADLRLTNPRFTGSSGLFDKNGFSNEETLSPGSELQFSITLTGTSKGEDVFAFDTNVEGKPTIELNLTSTVGDDGNAQLEIKIQSDGQMVKLDETETISFDTTNGGKFFTIKNTGDAALRLSNPRFTNSSGLFEFDDNAFSSEKTLQPGSELQFSITLTGASKGTDVFIFNTNVDGNSTVRLNLTSTVVPPTDDKSTLPDVNPGSNSEDGNLIYGDPNTTVLNDDFEIMVNASVGNEFEKALEALTLEDDILAEDFVVENDSSVDINATIVPKPEHENVYIVIVAGWDDQEGTTDWEKVKWYRKELPKDMVNDTGWRDFAPDLSKLYIPQYIRAHSGEQSHFVNVFTGQLLPPEIEGFGTARRVHFVVGYTPNNVIYLLSQPITLKVPVPLTPKDVEIKLGESQNVEIQIGSKGTIGSCKVGDETIARVFSQGNFSCGLTGLKVGTTTLTVTGVEPDSTSITTITVVE